MKTNRLFCIFLLSLLTGGHCNSTCKRKGEEGIILKDNGGKVTLQVITTEEIHEVHWLKQQTSNLVFRMAYCCAFKSACCRNANPTDCCRIENETYEAKLCSCNVSKLTASITICNVAGEDEGAFQAHIYHKNDDSTCIFYLNIDGNDDRDVKPENNIKRNRVISAPVIGVVILLFIIGAVIYDFLVLFLMCHMGIRRWIMDRCCRGRTSRLESSAATSDLHISCRSSNSDRRNPEPNPECQPLSSGLELKPMALPTSDRSPASCRPNPGPGPGFECSSL